MFWYKWLMISINLPPVRAAATQKYRIVFSGQSFCGYSPVSMLASFGWFPSSTSSCLLASWKLFVTKIQKSRTIAMKRKRKKPLFRMVKSFGIKTEKYQTRKRETVSLEIYRNQRTRVTKAKKYRRSLTSSIWATTIWPVPINPLRILINSTTSTRLFTKARWINSSKKTLNQKMMLARKISLAELDHRIGSQTCYGSE